MNIYQKERITTPELLVESLFQSNLGLFQEPFFYASFRSQHQNTNTKAMKVVCWSDAQYRADRFASVWDLFA